MTDNDDMDYLKKLGKNGEDSYKEPHTHCWHSNDQANMSFPPQYKEKCCWCGAIRTRYYELVVPEGHGQYAPKIARTRYDDK